MIRYCVLVVGALLGLLSSVAVANAQYPPPEGSLTSTGETSVDPGGTTDVTCTLIDDSGAPLAGEFVAFQITSDPGGSQLQRSSGVTDANGVVTVGLTAGSTAGEIEVTCSVPGTDLESTFVAAVLGAMFTPPNTGDGGLIGGSSSFALSGAAAALLVFVFVGGMALKLSDSRR